MARHTPGRFRALYSTTFAYLTRVARLKEVADKGDLLDLFDREGPRHNEV